MTWQATQRKRLPAVDRKDLHTLRMPSTQDALMDLALWKRPQQSGTVLGAATVVFYVFQYLRYTALSLLAHVLLAAVVGFFLWTSWCRFKSRPTPSVPKLEVSEAQVRAVVAQAVDMTNQLLALLYKLGTGQDPKQTAQACVALYLVSKVGSWFSFITLSYMATVLFFGLPKLYEKNQTEADKLLALASQQVTMLLDKLPKVQKIAKSD